MAGETDFALRQRLTGELARAVDARALFDRMAQAAWDAHAFVTEHMQGAELSEALARFLAVPVAVAGRIAETPHLFAD